MAFYIKIRLMETNEVNGTAVHSETIHAEGEYVYRSLELAREAEQAACKAAALMMPTRSKASSDEDWTDHPDRSDAADV